jgi:hypothetical protein
MLPQMAGRRMGQLLMAGLGAEMIYSFVIIVCSLMIYFGTKELYELSSHKGIKYFRKAFLFFALAYFFRTFIKFGVVYFNVRGIFDIPARILNPAVIQLTLFIFMYFSSMAIFYLLYSVMWKKLNGNSNKIYIFHFFAVAISFYSIFSRNPYSYIVLNLVLFFFILFIVYVSYRSKEKTKKHNLYIIYILLLFFWLLNIIDILVPRIFDTSQIFIYLSSCFVFLMILYKVLKRTGS